MTEPIVFISRNRIIEGKEAAWAAAWAGAVEMISSAKPKTTLFAAYFDETRSVSTVIHAFPDAAAMVAHFEGSDARSASVGGLITPKAFEVYGPAPAAAVEQLRRDASATGARLDLQLDGIGGVLRASP